MSIMNIATLYEIFLQHSHVQTDTRKLQSGDIYFSLKGDHFDGNKFAQQALDQGASYAVIDDETYIIDEKTILVDNVLETLQALALHHRMQFDIPFIAITGSNGKTTTKELLMSVLKTKYITYATEGNLNNHIGVPLTILKIKKDAQMAIIEMGANHQKEIESYCKIAKPNYALINNCGKAHLEGFGGIEGVRKGKGELFDFIRENGGTIFLNTDFDYLLEMAKGIDKQISYGSVQADYVGKIFSNNPFLQVAITTLNKECLIKTQLVGDYNFANVMAAVCVGSYFDISIDKIKIALEAYSPSNSRSQLIKKDSNTIILDAYNANPTSMHAAIKNFTQSDYPNKVLILGAMMELGDESIEEHQQLIKQIEETNWNKVVLVGGDFKKINHPFLYFDKAEDAAQWYKNQIWKNTAILIKGSRSFAMEKVLNG